LIPPKSSAKKRATTHALLNILNLLVFAAAFYLRTHNTDQLFIVLIEAAGMGLMSVAGWMGGTLVYRNQIAVDHRYAAAGKWREVHVEDNDAWVEIPGVEDLKLNQLLLVHAGRKRIAVGRTDDGLAAFDDHCTHRGGPLSDGALICGTVQCPWHGSQFNVHTGHVKAGPADASISVYQMEQRGDKWFLKIG
jgi:nitrite reductase/ring-hydroxylating ferredoxin subunit